MTFSFIEAEKATNENLSIAWACRTLGVSTSGFYDWRQAQATPCERAVRYGELSDLIIKIHAQSRGTYGAPRIHAELRLGRGIHVGRKRVERLMRNAGLEGITRRRHRKGSRRVHEFDFSDDLVSTKTGQLQEHAKSLGGASPAASLRPTLPRNAGSRAFVQEALVRGQKRRRLLLGRATR